MENPLPDIIEFNGTGVKEGDFKVAMNKLRLYLDELLGDNGQNLNLIPVGIISMWSGAANAIPPGWTLCDGENGTPDLRNRFVIGAGSEYGVGETGGAASASVPISGSTGDTTLTVSQMPSHNHGVSSTSFMSPSTTGNPSRLLPGGGTKAMSTLAGGNESHSHSLSGSATVSTIPPYYALCFIMKL